MRPRIRRSGRGRRRRAPPGAWPTPRRRSGPPPRPRGGWRPSTSPRAQGTTSCTTRSDPRRRSPSTRRSSSTPSPVRAEMRTEPSLALARALASSGAASALFTTIRSGTSDAPISASTSRTAAICPAASTAVASTTCTIRSASRTESRVERNASISSWGNLRTNPTVSVTSTVSPPGSESCRVRGSRVTKSRFSAGTPASVSRLSSVDFPALV